MLICPFLFTGHGTRSTQSRSAERQSRNGNFEFSFLASLCEIHARLSQYAMGPTSFSTSAISTMTMASHGQPSRKQPSGPLLRHFLQPIQRIGSIWMRPNGGLSSSGTQNMQSSTGQYSTQAGDPAQPVQHSVMTASSLGFFLRAVAIPLERGSCFISSGTIPGAFATCGSVAMTKLYLRSQDFVTGVLLARLPEKDAKQPAKPDCSAGFHVCINFLFMPSLHPSSRISGKVRSAVALSVSSVSSHPRTSSRNEATAM